MPARRRKQPKPGAGGRPPRQPWPLTEEQVDRILDACRADFPEIGQDHRPPSPGGGPPDTGSRPSVRRRPNRKRGEP